MLAIIISAMLALGLINTPDEATQQIYDDNQETIDAYILAEDDTVG